VQNRKQKKTDPEGKEKKNGTMLSDEETEALEREQPLAHEKTILAREKKGQVR